MPSMPDQKPTLEYATPQKRIPWGREQWRSFIMVLFLAMPFVVVAVLWILVWLIGR